MVGESVGFRAYFEILQKSTELVFDEQHVPGCDTDFNDFTDNITILLREIIEDAVKHNYCAEVNSFCEAYDLEQKTNLTIVKSKFEMSQ